MAWTITTVSGYCVAYESANAGTKITFSGGAKSGSVFSTDIVPVGKDFTVGITLRNEWGSCTGVVDIYGSWDGTGYAKLSQPVAIAAGPSASGEAGAGQHDISLSGSAPFYKVYVTITGAAGSGLADVWLVSGY